MAWIRCDRGEHIYDSEKYSSCPFCRQVGEGISPTVDVKVPTNDAGQKWFGSTPPPVPGGQATEGMPVSGGGGKTQSFWGISGTKERISEPVVGWVVVVSDVNTGQDFRLHAGHNKIGRDTKSDLFIDFDSKVSREDHAAIIYDPMDRSFYVQHMAGHNNTYLNGTILLESRKLKPYDVIIVGDTKLLFVPLCGPQFQWKKETNERSTSEKTNSITPDFIHDHENA